jgi:hypothetical protein
MISMRLAAEFLFYRIIGNDLPPRHRPGQSLSNVQFILENEPDFPGWARRWIVNRIVRREDEDAILALLDSYGQRYLRVPFDLAEYAEVDWDLDGFPDPALFQSAEFDDLDPPHQRWAELRARSLKVNYVMNVNGARNLALRDGRRSARWVLPWDGNCFLTEQAWVDITRSIAEQPNAKYVIVPLARLCSNDELRSGRVAEYSTEEPQIVFRADAVEAFDERYPYGWRNKTELLVRLGVPGVWDTWTRTPWDLPAAPRSTEADRVVTAGWVARLTSGNPRQERGPSSMAQRGRARSAATVSMIDDLDASVLDASIDPDATVCYRPERLDWLRRAAEAGSALVDGLIQRAESTVADPHRLFDGGILCALAWEATKEQRYADRGAGLVRRWSTRSEGVFAARDLYYFLDAARILEGSGALGADDVAGLRDKLSEHRDGLSTSTDGLAERRRLDHRGTCYDLQLGAVAHYLGDTTTLAGVFRRFRERLRIQFAADGSQPREVAGHQACSALQSWLALATLAQRCGQHLWHYETADGRGLRQAMRFALQHGPQWTDVEAARFAPLRMTYEEHYGGAPCVEHYAAQQAVFHPSCGIRPYWFL